MNVKKLLSTALAAAGISMFYVPAYATTFSVDSNLDAVDAQTGDGVCLTADGTCTLRAAIMEANATPGADIIDLTAINNPADPIVLTIQGVDEIIGDADPQNQLPCTASITAEADKGDLDITEDLQIVGAGPGLTVIKWNEQSMTDPNVGDRIFHIQAVDGGTVNLVTISDLMVTGGSVGIPNEPTMANPYTCEVTGEAGSIVAWYFKRFGGGIAVGPGAGVALFEETVHGPGGGGGGGEGPPPDVGPGGDEGEGGVTAVEFVRVAVIGNQSGADAGGIIAAAEMTIADSVLSGNLSNANGGALYLDSATTISGTLIGKASFDVPYESGAIPAALVAAGNTAENGGGIFDTGFHTTSIDASAINGNTAIGGGGIAARSLVAVNISNTTISGNTGTDVGGGITTNGAISLQNVTVADNTATTDAPGGGAGLNSFGSGTFVFFNTILSNNVVAGGEAGREANCGCSGGATTCQTGRMVSTGYNINDEVIDTCSLNVALNDQPNTDPLLEPLAMNGGLTETHKIPSVANGDAATSPAVDTGHTLRCPNNDQRGLLRPDDGDLNGSFECDIGAFEMFIFRTDLHINNVVVPAKVDKGATFDALVEIHNDDGNNAALGVTLASTLDPATGLAFTAAVPTAGTCEVTGPSALSCAIGNMAVGAVATVTVTLSAVDQGSYAMTSVVAATEPLDPVPGNNTVVTHLRVVGNSDIGVSADALPAITEQGDTVTMGFTVINNGEDVATGARLGMVVPAGTSFVAATSVPGACTESASEIVCTIGELALAGTAAVQVQLAADEAGDVAFLANVGADQTDPDDSNNAVTLSTTVRANADLAMLASSVGAAQTGGSFAISLGITNNGPQAATSVVATANLPALVSFVSSPDCTASGAVVTCTLATLAAGERVTFAATVSALSAGTATVSASVSADENDPNPDNNSGSVSITISSPSTGGGGGGGGGGGCVYNPAGHFDPTLLMLLAGALMALSLRRRSPA
ncbi:MAG: DUF11 domain-containing protein [Gammaproteobacteria bacterium]|nr:DUF11 domain-containing protein [Gammaproteobacteria bacterium]MDH4253155.1 DUF11 domain-containing protein [Gammaproteobacteria bacterium]MDH5308483.1 DUF11 domain-containing protein [Gammaproteobacteria bacterium]